MGKEILEILEGVIVDDNGIKRLICTREQLAVQLSNLHERVVKPTFAELNRYTNRIVVVDHRQGSSDYGRTIDAWHVKLEFDWQDYGKTLKIFINDK